MKWEHPALFGCSLKLRLLAHIAHGTFSAMRNRRDHLSKIAHASNFKAH